MQFIHEWKAKNGITWCVNCGVREREREVVAACSGPKTFMGTRIYLDPTMKDGEIEFRYDYSHYDRERILKDTKPKWGDWDEKAIANGALDKDKKPAEIEADNAAFLKSFGVKA